MNFSQLYAKKYAESGRHGGKGSVTYKAALIILLSLVLLQGCGNANNYETLLLPGGKNIQITGYTGKSSKIKIPSRIKFKKVTQIGDDAFADKELTDVDIPDSITSIGTWAFARNKLASVKIGNNVTSIGDCAFADNSISSIKIPDSVVSIGDWAFTQNLLTEVTISNNVKTIGAWAFACNKLTGFTIPNSLSIIQDAVLMENELKYIDIGQNITQIGEWAFAKNPLTSVKIGANIKIINKDLEFSTFENSFAEFYHLQDRISGTYTLIDGKWNIIDR